MKNLSFLFLLTLILTILVYGCKKDGEPPLEKGRLLSLNNDQPVGGAVIRIYHNTIAEGNIDATVYTDSEGYFDFHAYDNVAILPIKSGWWNPLDQGYIMRLNGTSVIADNILYVIPQSNFATVIIHCDSVLPNSKPAQFRIWSLASLQKKMFSGDYLSKEIIYDPPHYGTFSYQVPLMDSLQNQIQFAYWAQNLWNADIHYWQPVADTSFVPGGSGQQVFEFYL